MEVLAFLIIFIVVLFVLFYIFTFVTGGWYAPLPNRIILEMFKVAKVSDKDFLIDLGSGDGRILIEAGKFGIKSLGFEINPFLYLISKVLIIVNNLSSKAEVRYSNFWHQDLSKATIITIFLSPLNINLLERKLEKDLQPGAKVVTYGLGFPSWKASKKTANGIFLYKK